MESRLPAGASGLHLGEAVAAVDWPVLPRQKRDLGGRSTVVADRVMHLARAASITTATAAPAVASPGLPAVGTALGLLIALSSVELLIVSAECELGAALNAN